MGCEFQVRKNTKSELINIKLLNYYEEFKTNQSIVDIALFWINNILTLVLQIVKRSFLLNCLKIWCEPRISILRMVYTVYTN